MGRRNMKRMIIAGLAGLALAAAPLAAQASTSGARSNATAACSTVFAPNCDTPVVAVSATSSTDLTPADDFAMQYAGPNPGTGVAYGVVQTNFSNSLQDGTEDWTWVKIATVPLTGRGGAFRF